MHPKKAVRAMHCINPKISMRPEARPKVYPILNLRPEAIAELTPNNIVRPEAK